MQRNVVMGLGSDRALVDAGWWTRVTRDVGLIDLRFAPGAAFDVPVPAGHNAFVYVYDGDALLGDKRQPVPNRAAGILSDGENVRIEAGANGARLLLLAGITCPNFAKAARRRRAEAERQAEGS